MQSHCTESSKSRLLEGNRACARLARRNPRDQQARHTRNLGMNCESGTGAGNTIAGLQVGNTLSKCDHGTGAAVSGTLRLIEPAADGLNRGKDSVPLDFADDL